MEDKELFELCRDVWEATRWDNGKHYGANGMGAVPKYDSDYLLEKLPKTFDGNWWLVLEPITGGKWSAGYKDADFEEWADTPLKSLLKLTLKLSEEEKL